MSEYLPKILIVGPMPPSIGGISSYICDLLNSNISKKFKMVSFSINRPLNNDKIPKSRNYEIIFDVSPRYLLKSIFITIYHLLIFPFVLLNEKPSVIHIHTPSYWAFLENSYYVLISKLFHKKVVLHIHGGGFDNFYLNSSPLMKFFIKYIISSSDHIVSLSRYWKHFLVGDVGIDRNKISIIYNGVNSSKYLFEGINTNKKDYVSILFIGGVDGKRKGVYDVIKAIPLVINCFTNVVFTFIGKGELEDLKQICHEMGIEEYTRFLGQVTEDVKIKELISADIFLLPSHAEGLPISILEAMSAGLAVISTKVGAIPEVLEEGINGYLISPGNHEELSQKILLLCNDEHLRKYMGLNNQKKINEEYDFEIVVKNTSKVYLDLIKSNVY